MTGPAEAAHLQSRRRTEPMRPGCRTGLREVSIPQRMLRRLQRHSSEIELADLLGLPAARRGFWGAESPIPFGGKREDAVAAWEHAAARTRIAVWCRLGSRADAVLEPSRRRTSWTSQRLEGWQRIADYDREKSTPDVAVEGTYFIRRGQIAVRLLLRI